MKKPGLRPLYGLAAAQGGYFTTAQAQGLGVSRRPLAYRVKTGDLARIEYGIYRLARHPSQPFEDVIVACLWAGEAARPPTTPPLPSTDWPTPCPPRSTSPFPGPSAGGVGASSSTTRRCEKTSGPCATACRSRPLIARSPT